MANRALISGANTLIDGLIMDVTPQPIGVINRTHELLTRFGGEKVETGRIVTDLAEAQPKVLKLTCIVSDFLGADSVTQVEQQLEAMQAATTTFSVTTEWGSYPEMALRRSEAATQGRGMSLSLEVREIQRVTVGAGEVPPANRSGPAVDRGPVQDRGLVFPQAGPSLLRPVPAPAPVPASQLATVPDFLQP